VAVVVVLKYESIHQQLHPHLKKVLQVVVIVDHSLSFFYF